MRATVVRRWTRRLPITMQVLLLALAAVGLAQAISYAVILLTAAPPPPRMTLASARDALASEAGAQAVSLDRQLLDDPPLPADQGAARMNAVVIAHGLGVDPSTVRFRLAGATRDSSGDERSLVITVPTSGRPSARLTRSPPQPASMSPELAATMLAAEFPLPAFEAAWHRPDGRWVVVAPRTPLTSDWRFRLAVSLVLGLSLVSPLAWLAARRLTRPILALAAAAGESRLGATPAFPDYGPPEVRDASTALLAMHRRIETQFEDRMRMLVAIAHDLRTPLTALRLRIETTDAVERVRQTGLIQRMERMICEILDYAATSKREVAELVDVAALVHSLLPDADAMGAPVRFHGANPIEAHLPPVKLGRIVTNLLDNAVRYAAGVEVAVSRQGGAIMVSVADRGPGIAEADLERVLEPFERIERSRSRRTGGIGLGLTIARDLAMEMGGTLLLRRQDGGGLIAELHLPDSADRVP